MLKDRIIKYLNNYYDLFRSTCEDKDAVASVYCDIKQFEKICYDDRDWHEVCKLFKLTSED